MAAATGTRPPSTIDMSASRPVSLRWLPTLIVGLVAAGLTYFVVHGIEMNASWRVIWLSSATALALAAERFVSSRSGWARRSLIAVMVIVCAGSLYVRGNKVPAMARGEFMQGWNVYHYYMGSKYFDELGYFDLYKYTFLADREDRKVLRPVRQTRDLHDYSWVTVDSQVASIKKNVFSPERWSAFKADLRAVFDHTSRRTARRMVTDLGYNATPFGHLLFWSLSSNFSLSDDGERTFLLSLDWLLLIPAFFVFGRAFGAVRGLGMFTCFLLFFGTWPFQFAGMLRFFWLAAALVAIGCYKLGHYKTAGVAFALAVAERVFPLFFLIGPGLWVAWTWFRTRQLPRTRLAFAATFLGTLAICFLATLSTGRGLRGWSEFGENMFHHSSFQYLVEKKFGVKRLFSHDFSADKQPRSTDKKRKRKIFRAQETYYELTFFTLLGCVALIYLASDEHNSMLVGMIPAFVLEDISKYYLILWFLLFCVGPPLFRQRYKFAVFDIVVVGLIPGYYALSLHTNSPMTLYTSANVYMVGTVVLLTGMLLAELVARRRVASSPTAQETAAAPEPAPNVPAAD